VPPKIDRIGPEETKNQRNYGFQTIIDQAEKMDYTFDNLKKGNNKPSQYSYRK
jgi:hypothetical protein